VKDKKNKNSTWKIALSTLAAAFGVQNRQNHENDFEQQSPLPYIIAGVVFTALFVLALVAIVKIVLRYTH
jgi:uncharacterized membrane protein YidH (DUF202 family)